MRDIAGASSASRLFAGGGVRTIRVACSRQTSISSSCQRSPCIRPCCDFFFEMSSVIPISFPYSFSFCRFCRISYKMRSCIAASSAAICSGVRYDMLTALLSPLGAAAARLPLVPRLPPVFPCVLACEDAGRAAGNVAPGSSKSSTDLPLRCRGSVSMSKELFVSASSGVSWTSCRRRLDAYIASAVSRYGSPFTSCLVRTGSLPRIMWCQHSLGYDRERDHRAARTRPWR